MKKAFNEDVARIIISVLLFTISLFLPSTPSLIFLILSYLIISYEIYIKAYEEIKVKEIEHDEINVEINEKGEEKTCVESEESNILDLIDENNDNLLNQEEIVYWTPNGKTYHSKSTCRTLARSKIINSGTVNESGKDFKCENCK